MFSVLTAIKQLTTYAIDKAAEWDIAKQKQNDMDVKYLRATAVCEAYWDMAKRLLELEEITEKVIENYRKAFKTIEWQYCYDDNKAEGDCYYCPCCRNWIEYGHKKDCILAKMLVEER